MKDFSELGILPATKAFVGDKIRMRNVFDKEIIVHHFKVEPSKFEEGDGKRVRIQIEITGTKYVLFSGSLILRDMLERVPPDAFPFKATIIKEEDRHTFKTSPTI